MRFKKLLFSFTLLAYVLPYPGLMPGNKLYWPKQLLDKVIQYWSFGNLTRFKYELNLADKKLIESKTLFEYQQYPLALDALSSSNGHFQQARIFLAKADKEGKDIKSKETLFIDAAAKHREILSGLSKSLPKEYFWQPEKKAPKNLFIRDCLQQAIKIREI